MKRFWSWLEYCQGPSPEYEDERALGDMPLRDAPVSLIAYYLPQFHRLPQNDRWWGEGFTEWTNVARGLPRYVGHYQPRRPAALGYYDLSHTAVLRDQCALARRGGIAGLCFHYYWFSGETLLDTPIRNLLTDPTIDIRFCLNWANENWTRRWDGGEATVLLEQRYGPDDARLLAETMRPMLAVPRYIQVDGRPLVMIYRPAVIPDVNGFIAKFRRAVIDMGHTNPFIVAPRAFRTDPADYAVDGEAGFPPHGGGEELVDERDRMTSLDPGARGSVPSYDGLIENMLAIRTCKIPVFPGICPSWDNEARRGADGVSFHSATPAKYGWWLHQAARQAMEEQKTSEKFVFVNAWNEWAEGAYLEPDRHFGYAYLAETRRVLDRVASGDEPIAAPAVARFTSRFNPVVNRARKMRMAIAHKLRSLVRLTR